LNQCLLKITVLSENTVGLSRGVTGEWGLSLLVEAGMKRILFDTGEGGNLLGNAVSLGVRLKTVDTLVMSHGHYDHSGGMRSFLRHRGRLPVFAHPDLFSSHYSSQDNPHYIGVPFCREELESLGAEFTFSREPREIAPGIWVSGEVPLKTGFEKGDHRLFRLEKNGCRTAPDPLRDDMSLYCLTPKGLVIVVGCAHAGLVNIVEHGRTVTGVEKVYGIIGGTHLGPAPVEQQEATIAFLRGLDLQFLSANHCTGLPMIARLSEVFGSRFFFGPAGTTFTLPTSG